MKNHVYRITLIGAVAALTSGLVLSCEVPNEEARADQGAEQQSTPQKAGEATITLGVTSDRTNGSEQGKDAPVATSSSNIIQIDSSTLQFNQTLERPSLNPLDTKVVPQRNNFQLSLPEALELKEQVVVASPTSLDIGKISTSESRSAVVTLTNNGNEPVTLLQAKASCGCTTSDFKSGTVLQAGESTDITVTMNGKGRARKISKTVTFILDGYPPIQVPVIAEAIAYVTLDIDPIVMDEESGFTTVTLTSIDDQPFTVQSIYPAVVTDGFSTEPSTTQVLRIDWDVFWDNVTTTKIVIRLDHPLCREITTNVRMTAAQRTTMNSLLRNRRDNGPLFSKDPTQPLTGDQLSRYIKSGRGEQVLQYINDGLGKFDAVDRSNIPLLSIAAKAGDLETVKGLLELGAQLEHVDRTNKTPLMHAAQSKSPEVIQFLLDEGADLQARDTMGMTPLSWAAFQGTVEAVQILIDGGADANVVDSTLGYSPLLWASAFGDSSSISILIEAGADVMVYDSVEGRTPLMHAVRTGTLKGVRELLAAGAKVNGIDNTGMTALHIGTFGKNVGLDKIKLLVEAGADLNAKDKNDQTPLALAQGRTDDSVAEILAYLVERAQDE